MENITKKENKFPHDYDINNLISVRFADFVINVTKRYKEHYIENEYEKFSSDLFLNYIKEDSTVVDVGANYGYYSLLAATKNKSGVVYSFEPVKENFDVLNKNIKENDFLNVKTFNLAISDDSGEKNFNVTEASDSSGFYEHPNTEISLYFNKIG